MSDWHTAELYDFLPSLGIPTVVATVSRWVADPNRPPSMDEAPRAGTGVVPFRDYQGRELLLAPLSDDEVRSRIELVHRPYHASLDELIGGSLEAHGTALLLDLHCFAADLDADIVVGDRHGTTATAKTVDLVASALSDAGLRTAINLHWTGGWIVQRCASLPEVEAVQLELNARTYVDEAIVAELPALPAVDTARFATVKTKLRAALSAIADKCPNGSERRTT